MTALPFSPATRGSPCCPALCPVQAETDLSPTLPHHCLHQGPSVFHLFLSLCFLSSSPCALSPCPCLLSLPVPLAFPHCSPSPPAAPCPCTVHLPISAEPFCPHFSPFRFLCPSSPPPRLFFFFLLLLSPAGLSSVPHSPCLAPPSMTLASLPVAYSNIEP